MAIEVFRNKPFIVVCGCTGTGKTKLSIQLAQSLIKSGKKCEIVNGDAMQLYKNLDIITNKATETEMKNVKHHLVGSLDSNCITYNVIDYKNEAVQLIDSLLEKDVIPILVGGTHYYIQSVIWELLLDKNSDADLKSKRSNFPNFAQDLDCEIFDLLSESSDFSAIETNSNAQVDINVKLHDSDIKTEKIYQELVKFDEQSAQKIHPNDRRKLCRALQIYFTFGLTKTDLLDSRKNEKGTNSPLRYKNVCFFVMNCENKILNKRLDDRVDQMISNGMVSEIENFRKNFQEKFPNETLKSYSRNYEFGIFQSIGLKEFDDYFNYLQSEESVDKTKKTKLFDSAVLDMKLSTKRYAKTQIRWIKRFETITPIIHQIDTTDLTKWDQSVFSKALSTFTDCLNRYELDNQVEINKMDTAEEKGDHFQFNKCDICDRVFINKFQWECHLNGSKHKKRKENLSKKKKTTHN
ncbi:tRNA mitochondrial [Brachionus plicatilis]|uniref:tRNA mitochondrial n=1 Tax=Brachionus plicatilis TaxID=10195 RepID=A0A3M7RDI0_BRAPC|nr:tRNA mitochondrial [Brachionus plicatilis]